MIDLRQRVVDAPDDLETRLVYADALSERGDPRGEWIALECRRDREDDAQEIRRRALWQRHRKTWLAEDVGPLADIAPASVVTYRDGFVRDVELSLDEALQHGSRLAAQPLHTLRLTELGVRLPRFAGSPLLSRIRGLDLTPHGGAPAGTIERLLGMCATARLETLALPHMTDADELVRVLRAAPWLDKLAELVVPTELSPPVATWLARAMPRLRSLTCRVSAAALSALVETAAFSLRELLVIGTGEPALSDAIVRVLGAPACSQLAVLELALVAATPSSVAALPTTIERLVVGAPTSADMLAHLALPELRNLHLGGVGFGDAHVELLARVPTVARLAIVGNVLTAAGLERLVALLPELRELVVSFSPIGDAGVAAIANGARGLRRLAIAGVGLGRAGITAIARASSARELRDLDVMQHNGLTTAMLRRLADAPLERMASLHVGLQQGDDDPFVERGWLPVRNGRLVSSPAEMYERAL